MAHLDLGLSFDIRFLLSRLFSVPLTAHSSVSWHLKSIRLCLEYGHPSLHSTSLDPHTRAPGGKLGEDPMWSPFSRRESPPGTIALSVALQHLQIVLKSILLRVYSPHPRETESSALSCSAPRTWTHVLFVLSHYASSEKVACHDNHKFFAY